ncbi:probable pectinesterase/pectinesterase inhibitor 25 [Ricinus communis]|uniref:Pectinesterase n=1 Tax=Ricinus communis TaxID=3988 RepID=B9RPV5_RICCO|nr:probable pectinesterase/pectinesterase inhibitor 25 [Ricinus communis]EEF46613.1 Pectinesterase-2 precursor, putative [Ricinus communis]|eukprot:XP_002515774.1 probable pectinesterase/pectinesterase inhibitor 25 [Ricinus communis]
MPNLSLFFALLFLSSALLISSQSPPQSQSQSPSLACKSSLYPKLCRSILSTYRSSPSDLYDYSKFSVKQCIKQANRLSKAINYYLTHDKHRSKINSKEIGALEDCHELTQLNVDYLGTISSELKSAESMNDELVERVTSLLSGIVTNQQTCYDGLVESKSSIVAVLQAPLTNVTRLYSVSLGLVTHALDRNLKKNKRNKKGSHGKGILTKNRIREPLNTLIKALRKSSCHTSGGSRCRRNLADMEEDGILINDTVIVSPYGTDNFTSIGDAIAIAPNNSKPEDGYFVIYAREGYYEEYVIVPKYKKNILLIGDGINRTVITGNHSVVDGWTTFNSSTVAVSGERFVAVDVTFRNTAGPQKHQAVALRNNADLSTFYRCSFEGYQDTLYVHSLRQFYRECDIYGTVDFIFGNSAAVFQSCNLYARKPLPNQKNAFTAQGRTDPNQNTGISIHNCTIEAAPDLAMDLNSTLNFLGRPWKQYSRTVFMQSYIGDLISPVGWLEWNGTVGLDTLYYGEFENYGPGANTSMRVQWPGYNLMNVSQAANFTVYNFTMGDTWLPETDIPFSGGLLSYY